MIRIRPLLQSIAGALFITAQAYAAPPTIGETPTQSIEIQQTFVQQVQASDPEGGSLIYTLAYGPENMTISSSGLIEWATSATDAGSYDYKVWVEDDEALTAFQHFTVEVNDPNNNPPVFNGSPTESTTINTLYTFDASATDPDGDTIEYAINAWPAIEALTIDANGQVAWTTTGSDVGAYTIWVTADDGKMGRTKLLFQLEVHDPSNQAPVINGTPNNETYVGAVYEFDINAHDPDGDSLTYQIASWPEAAGISVDEHGLVTWQPTADQVGEYWLWVTVDDQRLGVTKEAFELRVIDPANTPPVIFNKSQDVVLNVGQAYTHDLQAADADGDPINYQLNTWPQDYGITLSNTGIVSWTPTSAHLSDVYLMIKIDDGRLGEDNHSHKITVVNTANNPPSITSSPLTSIEVNTAYQYTITAEDPENNALTFALSTAPAGMSIDANSGLITWAPTTVGNYPVTATVSDGINPAVTQSYTLTVSPPANTAPLANNQNVTTAEDTAISITLSASDNEGDALLFNMVSNPANGTLTGTAPNLSYTPNSNATGSDSFTFQVNDGALDSNIATVDISITPVNDAPTANPLTITTEEDSPVSITLSGSDIENDPLTFVINAQPTQGTLSGTAPSLTYIPNSNYSGSDSFTYYVNDGELNSESVAVNIDIASVNDAPVAQAQSLTTSEDESLNITLTGSDSDGDTMTFVIESQPSNGILSGAAPNFIYTPHENYFGGDSFIFYVNDGVTDSAPTTVNIDVVAVNDAPIAEDIVLDVLGNQTTMIALIASDLEEDELTYSLVFPAQNGITNIQNGEIHYTPNTSFTGADSLSYRVNDGDMNSNIATVSITVLFGTNTPPVITSPPVLLGNEGSPYYYQIEASDADGDVLSYGLVEAPPGVTVNSTSGLLEWGDTMRGEYALTVRATDSLGAMVEQSFDLTVTPSLPPVTSQGSDFWFMFNSNSSAAERLLYILSAVPTVATVEIPGINFIENYDVPANQAFTVDLTDEYTSSNIMGVRNTGVHLSTTQPISAYIINKQQFTTDASMLYPTNTLGMDYIIASYGQPTNSLGSFFGYVATEDNTTVTVTPTQDFVDIVGSVHYQRLKDEPYQLTLDGGQVYQTWSPQFGDLSGTEINADQPIAVFTGNRCTAVVTSSACDHVVEQLAPLNSLGATYFTLPLAERLNGDTVRVYASEDDTYIAINGELSYYLQAGEFYNTILDEPSVITATRPVQVMQFSNSSSYDGVVADPFMLSVPSEEQFLSAYQVTTPADGYSRNFLNVIVAESAKDTVRIDGNAIDSSVWQPIPNTAFVGAQISVGLGAHSASASEPFGLYVYGFDVFDSYGYIGGRALSGVEVASQLQLTLSPTNPELGDEVCIQASVTGVQGNPIAQRQVRFHINNAGLGIEDDGVDLTDTLGFAHHCYTRGVVASDSVTVTTQGLADAIVVDWQSYSGFENLVPVIVSHPEMRVLEGQEYQYQVLAHDPNNDVLNYALLDGPVDMAIDSVTGLVTWSAPSELTTGDLFSVTIQVTDTAGNSVQQVYNIIGGLPPIAPQIDHAGTSGAREQGATFSRIFSATDRNVDERLTWGLGQAYGDAVIDPNSGSFTWTADVSSPGGAVAHNVYCHQPGTVPQNLAMTRRWTNTRYSINKPLIGPLYDSNQNGVIDSNDRKAIVGTTENRRVVALDAETGQMLWEQADFSASYNTGTLINLDGDNQVEFVYVQNSTGLLVALNSDGSPRWVSSEAAGNTSYMSHNVLRPADLDNDGRYELLIGPSVFDSEGNLLWQFPVPSNVVTTAYQGASAAVDLNRDGYSEVIFNNEVRDEQGNLLWEISTDNRIVYKSYFAYGNFDSDTNLELVVSQQSSRGYRLLLLDDNGDLLWERSGLSAAGKLVIADFDNDTTLDIYLSIEHALFNADGDIVWNQANNAFDVGAIAADVDADGYLDILKYDAEAASLMIYEGRTGDFVSAINNLGQSSARFSSPLFVDIDNDGHGEIIATGIFPSGLTVIESSHNTWLPAASVYAFQQQTMDEVTGHLRLNTQYTPSSFGQLTDPAVEILDSGRLADMVVNSVQTYPIAENSWQIEAAVANRGLVDAQAGAVLSFYRDMPGDASNSLGNIILPELPANSGVSTYVFTIHDSQMLGSEIFAQINSDPQRPECVTENNVASARTFDIQVTDRDGLSDNDYWNFPVVEPNQRPEFNSSPLLSAQVDELYQYQVTVIDSPSDHLRYNFREAPYGASLDAITGEMRWVPKADQVGDANVSINVVDLAGNIVTQNFSVSVTPSSSSNAQPVIHSIPINAASMHYPYYYQVVATDPEGDYLHYELLSAPSNMRINRLSGRIHWVPGSGDEGNVDVIVRVSDLAGVSTEQAYTLNVFNNIPPSINSQPSVIANTGSLYEYHIVASDVDNSELNYSLPVGPLGMTVSSAGIVEWTPDVNQAGAFAVTVRVNDNFGGYAEQSFVIDVRDTNANTAPVIISTPKTAARVGILYHYPIQANDTEGDVLTFTLLDAPSGMTISVSDGHIYWTPGEVQMASIVVDVSDGLVSTQQLWSIDVLNGELIADLHVAPENPNIGEATTITVTGTNNAGELRRSLTLDGVLVPLDENGQAQYIFEEAGERSLVARVNDDYQLQTVRLGLRVRDPHTTEAPLITIVSPAAEAIITSPTDVVLSVSDDDLESWNVSFKRMNEGSPQAFANGTQTLENVNVGTLDPTSSVNGTYLLSVEAQDLNGNIVTQSMPIMFEGDLKVGNFNFTIQDLSIPLAGIPIDINRTYDSRRRNEALDFGFGWSIDYQNVRVEESQEPSVGWDQIQQSALFQVGDNQIVAPGTCYYPSRGNYKVSITLPDGDVERFDVRAVPLGGSPRGVLDPDCYLLASNQVTLAFEPEEGGEAQLELTNPTAFFLTSPTDGMLVDDITETQPAQITRYTLRTRAGYIYHLNQDFGIEMVEDPNGHTLTYSDSGVVHSSGKAISFVRNSEGHIGEIVDPNGNRLVYTRDANGDLRTVTDRDTTDTQYTYNSNHGLVDIIDPLNRRVLRNIYDDNGRLTGQCDQNDVCKTFNHDIDARTSIVTDLDGRSTLFNYDDRGNVTEEVKIITDGNYAGDIVTTYTYDANDNQETKTIGASTWTTLHNDSDDVTSACNPSNECVTYTDYNARGQEGTITDERGNSYTMIYDGAGNLTDVLSPEVIDPDSGSVDQPVASNVINSFGQVSSTTDLRGLTTTYTYYVNGSATGQKHTESNPVSGTTTYTYDANNNVETETRQRTVNGLLVNETTTYTYDTRDRVTRTTFHDGTYTEAEYDLAGNVDRERDRFGNWTDYDYDAYGRVTRTDYPGGSFEIRTYTNEGLLDTVTDRSGRVTRNEYDDAGRLWRVHNDSDGTYTETRYNDHGWVIAEYDALRNLTEYEYDLAGRRTAVVRHIDGSTQRHEFTYYSNGELHTETDANGHTTTYIRNELDQRIEVQYHNSTTMQDRFDFMGTRIANIDQATRRTDFAYDALGRLVGVTPQVSINGVPVPETSYTYDEVGNKLTQTDAEGRTTTWTYDLHGRVLTRTLPLLQQESFVYTDGQGCQPDAGINCASTSSPRLSVHTDFNGDTITSAYDVMGRVIAIVYSKDGNSEVFTYYDNDQVHTVTDQHGTTEYIYDVNNRLDTEIKADGSQMRYDYDAVGNRTLVEITRGGSITSSTTYTYDNLNRLDDVIDSSGTTTYTYDAVGNLDTVTYPNGLVTDYNYNSINQLTDVYTRDPLNTIVSHFNYSLTLTGRREIITELDGRTTAYCYDDLYRLTDEVIFDTAPSTPPLSGCITDTTEADYVARYEYDMVGNRDYETVDGVQTAYSYDDNDRLTQSGGTIYGYDNNGNTLTETLDGVVKTYTWDGKNKLISVDDIVNTTSYEYNHNGIRISKTDGVTNTQFIVDENTQYAQLLEEVVDGAQVVAYSYGHDLIGQERNGSTHFYHYDGLGSTRALSDTAGSLVRQYDYEAFGELLNETGTIENNYLFTGEQFDSESGNYYLRARYMSPMNGNFLSMDTYQGRMGEPATLHKYLYTHSDPINNIDPSGNVTLPGVMAAVRITGIFAAGALTSYQFGQIAADGVGGSWDDGFDLRPGTTGWLVLAAMVGSSSGLLANIADGANEEDDQEYELYHGTDLASGLALLNGAHITLQPTRNWPGSNGGFYLATDFGDAVHHANVTQFGQRSDPAVIKYTFDAFAYQTIKGISIVQPIPAGTRYRPAGSEVIVPPGGFHTFNNLLDQGRIRPGPP